MWYGATFDSRRLVSSSVSSEGQVERWRHNVSESEVFNKGKGRLYTKDLNYEKVSKCGFEIGTGISTKEGVVFTNASVFEAKTNANISQLDIHAQNAK